jgi:hemoglobin
VSVSGPVPVILGAGAAGVPGDLATRDDIAQLVRRFYRDVSADDVLGPVFSAAGTDWADHIPQLVTFWSWQLLGDARYEGRPLRAHERVNGLVRFTDAHYDRWLDLFHDTVDAGWSGPVAELAKRRADKIARALRRHLDESA